MSNLLPVEHNNQRVLTTQQLAEAYQTDTNNISKNFANNRERFIEGRDYYFLQGEELQSFKRLLNDIPEPLKFTPQLYLWTERGANRHCKILDTDKAWEQFDILEETYFNIKISVPSATVQELSPQLQVLINLELKQKQLENEVNQVKTTLHLVKSTVGNHPEDNWRDTINSMFNKIVKAVGNKEYQKIRSDSYKLLEERAGVNLNIRLENYRTRLSENGSTKSKISSANKLDIIESDKKLREIYTGIIKELTIKHVA